MNKSVEALDQTPAADQVLAGAVEELIKKLEAGERVDLEAYGG